MSNGSIVVYTISQESLEGISSHLAQSPLGRKDDLRCVQRSKLKATPKKKQRFTITQESIFTNY